MKSPALSPLTLATLVVAALPSVDLIAQTPAAAAAAAVDGATISGSRYTLERPANWNGTLLLYSHGWWGSMREPEDAPPGLREPLLSAGYALAGSTYAAPGWAVAEAVPDQLATLDAFIENFGMPKRTVAWGNSMGGLVSTAIAERHADRIDGALTMCASSAGALGMLNMGLDGAFAFVTLVAPGAGVELVGIDDDRANGARVAAALETAQQTAAGRARIALASVLGGLPDWTRSSQPKPAADDYAAIAAEMSASFVGGVFLPRAEQEMRAGGVYSWNTGVDYRALLASSGRRALVERLYAAADLDLESDLDRLNDAPKIDAEPRAVDYMRANFTPSGRIGVPTLSLHTLGDGLTSPSLQRAFVENVVAAGRGELVAAAWNDRAGHCSSTPGEMFAALGALEMRLTSGEWRVAPAELNAAARAAGESAPSFVAVLPAPMPRPCADRSGACPGLPRH
jgi:pimeloyl-ACP methyl ester carboxylesterase